MTYHYDAMSSGLEDAVQAVGYEPFAEIVVRHLREQIYEGLLNPGSAIRQEAVAKELGVSRIPVREALRKLEAEGLVTIRPHSGARVAVLDFEECIEIYKIRERLEPLAFSESVGLLTEEQLAATTELADHLETLTFDARAWVEVDRRFHIACYAGASGSRVVQMVADFWGSTQQYRRILVGAFTRSDFDVYQCDHRLMVDALYSENRRAGEEVARLHIERARLRLASLRQLFDR